MIEGSTYAGGAWWREGVRGGKGGGRLPLLGSCADDVIFPGKALGSCTTHDTLDIGVIDLYEAKAGSVVFFARLLSIVWWMGRDFRIRMEGQVHEAAALQAPKCSLSRTRDIA
jgi:hypothetical protein